MILEKHGDILADYSAHALVCPVNCAGAMGAGLALAFHEAFPGLLEDYRELCESGHLRPGRVAVLTRDRVTDAFPSKTPGLTDVWGASVAVVLFASKRHWKDPARYDDLMAGLGSLAAALERRPAVTTVAVPALGCGLGGLSWHRVRRTLEYWAGWFPERTFHLYPPKA